MDKYEYNVKLEQIKKLIKKKDYATAARIADTIDWYKVKNNQTIVMIADVYEASGRYDQSRENLKLAYDRSGLGRQIAYKLVKICIKCGALEEAEDFYDDFVSAAPKDISKYILEYELAKAKGDPIEKQISILEQYLEEDMDDKWAFELAKLYHKSGQRDKCIHQCDTVMLWFSDGKYVERAMDLKMIYTPLNKKQQERYEARWREKTGQVSPEEEEIRVKEVDVSNKYNTQNIQAALKESMEELYSEEKKENNKRENIFRPTMPSPEYEETEEELYAEEALYDEAEETVAGTDEYLYRMNQNQQYNMSTDDFAQETEHRDDLGDTKVFVTTRSRKNLGDTKVFAPIRQAVPERIGFEETIDKVENEAYILEEKTIKNKSKLIYEEEAEENLEEIWGNPEEAEGNPEEAWGSPEEAEENPEEAWGSPEEAEENLEEAWENPEEAEENLEEAWGNPEEAEENLEEIWGNPEYIAEEAEEELEEAFVEGEEEQGLPVEELEDEFTEEDEEQELPIEELEEELEDDPDVLSEEELEELLEEDISEEAEEEASVEELPEKEELMQETEDTFESKELLEEIQKGWKEFIAEDSPKMSEDRLEATEFEVQEMPEQVSQATVAATSEEEEAEAKEDFEEAFSVEDFFNNADEYYISENKKEDEEMSAPKEEKSEYVSSDVESEEQKEILEPEYEYQELKESAVESEYGYHLEEEALGEPEEYENQYQELKESTVEPEYEYQPEPEELDEPENYENQYQELKESTVEPEYEYQPEPEELDEPESYENQYQELKESTVEPEYEYQPEPEELDESESYENQYQELKEPTVEPEYEYQPEVEELDNLEEYQYQELKEPAVESEPEYEYEPMMEELGESEESENQYQELKEPAVESEPEYEYQPQPEELEYEAEVQSEPEESEYEYQPELEESEYEAEVQSELEQSEYEYQPELEEPDVSEESENSYQPPKETDIQQPEEPILSDTIDEDDESEEDNEVLTHDEIKAIIKDFIGKYSGVQGLDKQMLKTLQNIIVDDNCNIIIMGDAKSGKTSLGIDIIKVVNKIKRNNNRRIAKISADKLIGKELSIYFTRLRGSDIYIENISLMDDNTLAELLEAMDKDVDNRIVVIEDEKVNAEKFLDKHVEIRDYFANQIIVKQNKIKDWVEVAREYAEEQGYRIDEMGMLALHARIDQLYAVTLVIQKNHVDAVIDSAIKKAGKGGLLKKLFGKKKEKILTEEHFSL